MNVKKDLITGCLLGGGAALGSTAGKLTLLPLIASCAAASTIILLGDYMLNKKEEVKQR